jgi:predicted dehydrogenase
VAVIGVGAFGRNHARVYQQLQQAGSVRLVGVVDPDTARADAVAREFGCKSFGSAEQMLTTHSEVQAASVAVPTVLHRKVARTLMEAGVDVLIEKPVAATLDEADELIRVALKHKRVAQVGHLERFNPAVRATLPLITRPMFFEVHRLSVFSPRALDVDVVLDLMIHDLDVVLTLVKSEVKEIRAVGLPVLSGKVDIANVRIEFASGCVANFTASRVSTERVRKLRFFQPRQYISVDYGRQEVLVFSVGDAAGGTHPNVATNATLGWGTQASVNPQIAVAKPAVVSEEPLLAEIKAFLQAVRQRSRPVVSLEDGRRALELGLAILAEIARHAGRIGVGKS